MHMFVFSGKIQVITGLAEDDMPQCHGSSVLGQQMMLQEPFHQPTPELDHALHDLHPAAGEECE